MGKLLRVDLKTSLEEPIDSAAPATAGDDDQDTSLVRVDQLVNEGWETGPFLNVWSRDAVAFLKYPLKIALPEGYGAVVEVRFVDVSLNALIKAGLSIQTDPEASLVTITVRWRPVAPDLPFYAWFEPVPVFEDQARHLSALVQIIAGKVARVRVDIWERQHGE